MPETSETGGTDETEETGEVPESKPPQDVDEPLRVVFSNQKGGVGKSTGAINVSGALNRQGAEVLFIDCDPQGMASDVLGYEDYYFGEEVEEQSDAHGVDLTLFDVLADDDSRDRLEEIIFEDHPEMDVVPSHTDMFLCDRELPGVDGSEFRLRDALKHADLSQYDFVIIDSPPYLGIVNDMAMLAAENVIIPAQARNSSVRALRILFDQIETIEDVFSTEIEVLGTVLNETRRDTESQETVDWFHDVLGSVDVFEVPIRVAIQRAQNTGVSVFEHEESVPDAETAYAEVADVLTSEVGRRNAH